MPTLPDLPWLLAALALGVLLAALASRLLVRRSIARARVAERRARAAEHLAEIGSMTGGLAHEIKNPLSTIGLNAQLLGEAVAELPIEPSERSRLARRVEALRRETDRLRGILEDFLEFAGELRIEPHTADLNAVVDELADFFAPQAAAQGVRLRTDLAPGALPARFDTAHLKQAVLNLMLNAVQAMTVPAANPAANPAATPQAAGTRELILRTERAADSDRALVVRLHVIDTGPGIPPERQAEIFRPYYTTKSGGTGLGLPTARRIAEAHGGRIELYSEPGRGTDFTIVLPAAS